MGAAPGPPAGWASRSRLSGHEPTTLAIMLNPGAAPIPDASETLAAANITVFAAAVADHGIEVGQPERDESADRDGRFGFVLTGPGGTTVHVLMPGVPLAAVRDMSTGAPCLMVGGEWWWWPSAVTVAAALMR